MGSSCSILNDTKHDVWITHGVNWAVFIGVTFGLLGGILAGVLGGILAREATAANAKVLGSSKNSSTRMAIVLGMTDAELAKALNISESEAAKMKRGIREFKENAKLIKPGEKYTWSGTLSLTKRVHVMNDAVQCDDRGCFTGPTPGSENVYPISEYFKKLDVN
jgi:hypothetical protein